MIVTLFSPKLLLVMIFSNAMESLTKTCVSSVRYEAGSPEGHSKKIEVTVGTAKDNSQDKGSGRVLWEAYGLNIQQPS